MPGLFLSFAVAGAICIIRGSLLHLDGLDDPRTLFPLHDHFEQDTTKTVYMTTTTFLPVLDPVDGF
jgi:hypothetical protein